MIINVTYVFHNCFVVRLPSGRALLFDPPDAAHRPPQAALALGEAIAGTQLTVMVSHSHADHFDPHVGGLLAGAHNVDYVVSDDVADMHPQALPPEATLVMEPGQRREWRGLAMEALESNDLGVAFLVEAPREGGQGGGSLVLYHGGDLADWSWPQLPPLQRSFTGRFFGAALNRLAGRGIDLAFSNVDARLEGLAGGPQFVRVVRPRVFAPMHAFGRMEVLELFRQAVGQTKTRLFLYGRPGDSADFDL